MVAPGWVDTPGERVLQAEHGRPDFPAGVRNLTTAGRDRRRRRLPRLARRAEGQRRRSSTSTPACTSPTTPGWSTCPPTRGPVTTTLRSPCGTRTPDRRRGHERFIYCLNTSTIRPTPLLEKIRIAGRGRLSGDRALERRDRRLPPPRRDARRAEVGPGRRRAEGRERDRARTAGSRPRETSTPSVLDECRRRMDQAAAAGQPVHRRQPAARGRRPGPRARRGSPSCCGSGESAGRDPVDGVPRVRRRDQERRDRLGDRRGHRRPRRDRRGRRLPHDPRRRLGRRPAHARGRPSSPTSTSTTCRPSPTP